MVDCSSSLCFYLKLACLKTKLNLKNASFVVIMLSNEGLTHIQSQIKPGLLFGESFTLKKVPTLYDCKSLKCVLRSKTKYWHPYYL